MTTLLLAVISGAGLLNLLIQLIIAGLIFWIILWAISYIGIPEPFAKVVKVILALVVLVFLINVLLGIGGHSFIAW